MTFEFCSKSKENKTPFGAVCAGETVSFTVMLSKDLYAPRLHICPADQWDKAEQVPLLLKESCPEENRFCLSFTPKEPALLFYRFDCRCGEELLSWGPDADGKAVAGTDSWWQLTVTDPNYRTPDFIKDGLYYQIFPDRFYCSGSSKENVPADRKMHPRFEGMPDYLPDAQGKIQNNDYFGGDLLGITQKIPYLQSLGVSCLYLNPIFEAHSNHRYNTADYRKVDPMLGTQEDFRILCQKCHEAGIRVLLDGVFSHAGSDSVYFNREGRYGNGGAFRDPQSPYRDWFQFGDYPGGYACWWGIDTLPNLREENPDYQNFICGPGGVLDFWMDLGTDGFRLDVADELPDGFLDAVRARLKSRGDKLLIGEVWEDASNKIAYEHRRRYLLGKQLDGVMDYPVGGAILNFIRDGGGKKLDRVVLTILENYPPETVAVLMNCLSTHDIPRAITQLAGEPFTGQDRSWQASHHVLSPEQDALGKSRLRLASLLQYFLPGVPSLYYGDEAGLCGYRDPFNRCPYPWGKEDPALLDWFRALGQERRAFGALLAGGRYVSVQATEDFFSFLRMQEESALFVAVNRGDLPQPVLLPGQIQRVVLGQLASGMLVSQGFLLAEVSLS